MCTTISDDSLNPHYEVESDISVHSLEAAAHLKSESSIFNLIP